MWRNVVGNVLRQATQNICALNLSQRYLSGTSTNAIIILPKKNASIPTLCGAPGGFHILTKHNYSIQQAKSTLLIPPVSLNPVHCTESTRNVTKFSLNKGKRKTVKAVLKRFKRLDWGAWIRTYTGRHKKMWKKSAARKRRLKQHVFVNATQSWLLDKMVTSFWRRRKYWIDDPYQPYHKRDEFFATKRTTFKV